MTEIIRELWPEWTIEKMLGRGSYGTVYRAVRRGSPRDTAAIKVISIPNHPAELETLRAEGLGEEEMRAYLRGVVEDFIGEIRLMDTLKESENIVHADAYAVREKTQGIGWDIFIRMEELTPLNLYFCGKYAAEEEIIRLGIDLCSALEACAKHQIIHRDIKPENIFVDTSGTYKLGDFGIARKLEHLTFGLSQKGTMNYIAPEILHGDDYDARADLYSLGIVLYRLFNKNRLPFLDPEKQLLSSGERKDALDRRLHGETFPPPCGASEDIAQIILCACAYRPDDRSCSAAEMKEALMRGKLSAAVKTKKRRHPFGLLLILTALLASALLTGTLLFRQTEIPMEPPPQDTEETEKMRTEETTAAILPTSLETTPPQTEAAFVRTELEILDLPHKTEYYVGDTLELSGIRLLLRCGDREEIITEGFTCTSSVLTKEGEQPIMVVYDGYAVDFSVYVHPLEITALTLETTPTEVHYFIGDSLRTEGIALHVTFNNGETETVTDGYTCSPTHLTAAGEQNVTVEYGGYAVSFPVSVSTPELIGISVASLPAQSTCFVGDDLQTNGLTLMLTYNNGKTEIVSSGYRISPTRLTSPGEKVITVEYGGLTTAFPITVSDVFITEITISNMPKKTTYYIGNTLDIGGLTLRAVYNNGEITEITDGFSCTPMKLENTGTQIISAAYGKHAATFTVEVLPLTNLSLSVSLPQTRTAYTVGDRIEEDSVYLELTQSDGSVKRLTSGYSIAHAPLTQPGEFAVRLSYETLETTYSVTVTEGKVMDEGTCGTNVRWTLYENGTLILSGSGAMDDHTLNYTLTQRSSYYKYRNAIRTIIVREGITEIGNCAFYSHTSLRNAFLGSTVTRIGDQAFYSCSLLEEVTLSPALTEIGILSFGYCNRLTRLDLPASVTKIGNSAFTFCRNLSGIYVHPDNTAYASDDEGVLFNRAMTQLIKCPAGYPHQTYIIPETVKEIYASSFRSCIFTSIEIPETVETIGELAFIDCTLLQTAVIRNPNLVFGDRVFSGCGDVTLIAPATSTARAYAKANIHTFAVLTD